jgi:hypothetical protein
MARQFFACVGTRNRHLTKTVFLTGSCWETAEVFARGHRVAWAQDVYPEEIERHTAAAQRDGVTVLCVFPTANEAKPPPVPRSLRP